jgi:hypothetical protein
MLRWLKNRWLRKDEVEQFLSGGIEVPVSAALTNRQHAPNALIERMAKRIQYIEHGGRHTWESCQESARQRAIAQAKACWDEVQEYGKPW